MTTLYIHIHYFYIHFHYSLSRSIEYSSLCYTKAPCCLSIQNAVVCIDQHWPSSQTLSAPRPHPPGLATTSLSCLSVSLSPFFRWEHLCRISDCTYKRYRTVSISLWPTSLSTVISSCTHVAARPSPVHPLLHTPLPPTSLQNQGPRAASCRCGNSMV